MRVLDLPFVYILLLLVISSCNSDQESLEHSERFSSFRTRVEIDDTVFSAYDYCREKGFWEQFNSLEERIEAVQLSEEELASFSTQDLLILCITNPLTFIFSAYNCELQAIPILADRLNVFKAYEGREDAANVLTDFYSRTTVSATQKSPCLQENEEFSLSLMTCNFLELYISSARIPSVLTGVFAETILQSAERIYDMKMSEPDVYSWFSYGKELLIREVINRNISSYKEAEELYRLLLVTVPSLTRSFDDEMPFLCLGMSVLNTKMGSIGITAYRYREVTFFEREDIASEFKQYFPGEFIPSEIKSTISSTYNCHGYAWHIVDNNTPTGNYWINRFIDDSSLEDNLERYWTNDYYQEVSTEPEAEKIYYSFADHSAIKASTPGYYVSKWGYGPLVTHTLSNCPYLVGGMRYFAHTANNSGGDDDGGNEDGGNEDGGNEDGGNEQGDPIPIISISGPQSISVGQSYAFQASQMFDTAMLEWSCSNTDAHISPNSGRTVYLTVDSAGRYPLVVEYNFYGTIMGRGVIIIQTNY